MGKASNGYLVSPPELERVLQNQHERSMDSESPIPFRLALDED